MSDFHILTAVRTHLLAKGVVPRVHLTLPPGAIYPLALIQIEEIVSHYSFTVWHMQACIKMKISIYAQNPQGLGEIVLLSTHSQKALEGAALWLPDKKIATIRFLNCAVDPPGHHQIIHQFYESWIRKKGN
jgi:hypothetical protein